MPEQQQTDDTDEDLACCVPESEMKVVRDRNMDFPWKGGNKYARICPECGMRTFCAKAYWQSRYADPESVAYIIKKGDEEPTPAFECPYEDCSGMLVGEPEECPECGEEIEWED